MSGTVVESIETHSIAPTACFQEQWQAALQYQRQCLDKPSLNPIRIAFLAASTLDHLVPVIRYWMARETFPTEIYVAPFRTIETEILDSNSALYEFKPDYVVLLLETNDLLAQVPAHPYRQIVRESAAREAGRWIALAKSVLEKTATHVLIATPVPPSDGPMGLQDALSPEGSAYRVQRITEALVEQVPAGITLWDLTSIAYAFGLHAWHQPALWFHSKHAFNLDAYGIVAHHFSRLIAGLRGQAKKVCVLDLDQTLWGGVIGDDGLNGIRIGVDAGAEGEAYAAFQGYLKELRQQGVLLAVCSKNEHETAKEPFLKHEGMVLKWQDFAAFEANWNNKADNLLKIAQKLNVGLQSLVFVDDNPVECDYVKRALPEVTVVHLADDPAHYISTLSRLRLFDKPHVTQEDRHRTGMIAAELEREAAQRLAINTDIFLDSLDLRGEKGSVDGATIERSWQLLHKTNQFNVTTRTPTLQEMTQKSHEGIVRWYRLRDRFGEYGIVSVVIAESQDQRLVIEAWVMSCRAFQRTLEAFVMRDLIELAQSRHCTVIEVLYRPTTRNGLVVGALRQLGFQEVQVLANHDTLFTFALSQPAPPTAIRNKEHEMALISQE